MGVYLYCLEKDYIYYTSIIGRELTNSWVTLEKNGRMVIRASYAWDGCSPKIKIRDICFGTPEGVLNRKTGFSKTYFASLIHDALCQFQHDVFPHLSRKLVDREFKYVMERDEFGFSRLYYRMVRIFSWFIIRGKKK